MLWLSFYNLNYGIGASASFIDQLNNLPQNVDVTIIEPNRVDLNRVKIELSKKVHRIEIPIPLTSTMASFLYPLFVFFYCLKETARFKPTIVFSMHHPFHSLSVTGHFISKIIRAPHIVDLRDVWRPMGLKPSLYGYLKDIFERIMAQFIKNDLMIFVCSENKQILESRTDLKFKNYLVLPNCVSDHLIEGVKVKKTPQNKEINFIFVGRVAEEYGLNKIQTILDAIPSFGYSPRLVVVGHSQVGIINNAKFLGNLPRQETINLIAESDVGIGPMYPTIAVPRKVVEYLSLGKIVIVGKNAVSKDIIKEYSEQILEISDTDDANDIVRKILSMIEKAKHRPKKTSNLYCSNKMKIILNQVLTTKKK